MNKLNNFFKIVFFSTAVLFFSWLIPHKTGINKLIIQSEDTLPAMFIPVAIIKEGTIYLDSYYDMLVKKYPQPDDKKQELGLVPYYLREVEKYELICDQFGDCHYRNWIHYVSAFPIITPLLALPVYFLPVSLGMEITWDNLAVLASLSSAFIMALSSGFLYLLLQKHFFTGDSPVEKPLWKQKSFLLTAIYLFATINFAHISQALWQHGTVQLFTILALLALYQKKYFWMGLSFGLMLLSRPTSGIVVAILGLLFLAKECGLINTFFSDTLADPKGRNVDEKNGIDYPRISLWNIVYPAFKVTLGIAPAILFFLWYNSTFYGTIANQGYSSQIFTEWQGRFPEGFLGLWLSPSKGILVYSPIFIFSLVGAYLALKNWKQDLSENLEYPAFITIVLLHILVLGFWKHWYGGWSFGYRMASDIIPFLVLLLVPFIKSSLFQKYKKLFFGSIGISILCQLMGLVFYDGIWHAAYDGGFKQTAWLWSVKNSELLFNIRRTLVKLGLRQSPF